MIYRYIYKITCLCGSFKDHYYYGQHTTNNLDDGYFASGRKIKDYRKKYPDGYKREILAFYDTEEELNKVEYEIIHPCLNDPMCLNIAEGGKFGRHPQTEETRNKISKGLKGKKFKKTHEPWHKGKTGVYSKERIIQISEQHKSTKWMTLNNYHIRVKQEDINHYLELGYHLGRK